MQQGCFYDEYIVSTKYECSNSSNSSIKYAYRRYLHLHVQKKILKFSNFFHVVVSCILVQIFFLCR